MDKKVIEKSIENLILSIGENINREGLKETPKRVTKVWEKICEGYDKDVASIFKLFKNENSSNQLVGLSNIEFYSTCEHHLLPFFGKAHIYYVPDKHIIGISKLGRLLDIYSRRLQNQERITMQIADAIEKFLKPKGVVVVLEAQHFCIMMRGIQKQNSVMKTSELRGLFKTDKEIQNELFQIIKL